MLRPLFAAGLVALLATPAAAQTWAPWFEPSPYASPSRNAAAAKAKAKGKKAARATNPATGVARASTYTASAGFSWFDDDDDDDDRPQVRPGLPGAPIVVSGGARPVIEPQAPAHVTYSSGQPAGTIVIDSSARRLYLIQGPSSALAYPVSVGREGFAWTGSERISRVADWPDWHPPAEMRERDPRLPTKMTGGIRNPLGAKALYLGSTLYRIHGTSDARSIGRAASSGCFRMHNAHVVDLAGRAGVGTKVVVVRGSRTRTATGD